jgi:uncharacterized protein YcbK (DUF882 family)
MPSPQKFEAECLKLNRRGFIKLSTFGVLGIFLPFPCFGAVSGNLNPERSLSFYNIHTGESLKAVYWAQGDYLVEALEEIENIFRDHRTGERKPPDTRLLDLLYAVRLKLGTTRPFSIISGYRSPKTNALLLKLGRGVAPNSLHMYGKAVDIRVPGFALPSIRQVAIRLRAGGVGYYSRPDFVHVDVGPVRVW